MVAVDSIPILEVDRVSERGFIDPLEHSHCDRRVRGVRVDYRCSLTLNNCPPQSIGRGGSTTRRCLNCERLQASVQARRTVAGAWRSCNDQSLVLSGTDRQHFNMSSPREISKDDVINAFRNAGIKIEVAEPEAFGFDRKLHALSRRTAPRISDAGFSWLRTLNLSRNRIVHIDPDSLPPSLQTLNLSENRIRTIGGLRRQVHLRVLDLSYNRLSRIGQGLAKCTCIKELYLGGNRVRHIEGLNGLMKLRVLDLSFNRIATWETLEQLAPNKKTLVVLNVIGNSVVSNVGDRNLRKMACGLLPYLAYLNNQPMKGVSEEQLSIAKFALREPIDNTRRRWGGARPSHAITPAPKR